MNKHLGISGVVVGVVIVEDSPDGPLEDIEGLEGGFLDGGSLEDVVSGLPELNQAPVANEGGHDVARAIGQRTIGQSADDEPSEHEPAEDGAADDEEVRVRRKPRRPCAVIVDGDDEVRIRLSQALGSTCQTHRAEPTAALALLEGMSVVDVAVVDCDQPLAVQAPIFRELARWPGALCVLLSADVPKVEQLRALGLFAPLVLDKPVQPEALEAIRSAALELFGPLSTSPNADLKSSDRKSSELQ